jgi:malate dehydrogenase
LAHKTEVNVNAVENVIVWGNHSSSMFPDFYHAKINDKFAHEVLSEKWLQEDFMHLVRNRGTEVIKARGVSSGASAASGIVGTLEKIFAGSREPYSLGCCSNGQYGVDEGLIFSFPYKNGKVVEGIAHASDFAKEQMQKTIEELRQEREIAREIGVIR